MASTGEDARATSCASAISDRRPQKRSRARGRVPRASRLYRSGSRQYNSAMLKPTLLSCAAVMAAALLLVLLPAAARGADAADPAAPVVLFNGRDLSGWLFRNAALKASWKVVSEVKLSESDPQQLVGIGEGGADDAVLFRVPTDHGSDIYTRQEFGDCELEIEFMVPRGSNSGVYLMGRYELQILDSYGKTGRLGMGDCGAIYSASVPSTNATRPPGQWQKFEVVFRAPRFDQSGRKIENARFVSVKLNGTVIQENVQVKGPTGGELSSTERPTGPILLQGDHGVVAFRNVRVRPVAIE